MKSTLLTMMLSLMCITISAQNLSLEECRQKAHDNYPAIKQRDLIEHTKVFTMQNAARAWLPQVSVSAGAYAFTDLIETSQQISAMGIDIKNWMANAAVSVNQVIYDGGQISAGRKIAAAQANASQAQLDVTMYSVYERVEQIYFGILLIDRQLAQMQLLLDDLEVSMKTVRNLQKGGLTNQSDVDAVRVEQLKAEQQEATLRNMRQAYLNVLSVYIADKLGENTALEVPQTPLVSSIVNNRPEIALFDSQESLIEAKRKQLNSSIIPTIGLTGMGMIYTNVTDLVKQGIVLGGISLKWNISGFYTRGNDIRKLNLESMQVTSQKETFLFNSKIQSETSNGNITSLKEQIAKDKEIESLRESIRKAADSKVELGTESVSDMIRDVNAVSQARLQTDLHEIQLLKELYSLRHINNN